MSDIFDEICDDVLNTATEIIAERRFVEDYLPLLFSSDPKVFNLRWINEVARSPHSRVYIQDATGKILYSVPPLRQSPISRATDEVALQLTMIKQRGDLHPILGANLMDRVLPNLIDVDAPLTEEIKQEWRAIFDRYGYSDKYVAPSEIEGHPDNNNNSSGNLAYEDDDEW